MGEDIGANVIACKNDLPASQKIALALEKTVFGQVDDFESVSSKPFDKVQHLAAPDLMAKVGGDKLLAPDKAGVGGENHIGQVGRGLHHIDLHR